MRRQVSPTAADQAFDRAQAQQRWPRVPARPAVLADFDIRHAQDQAAGKPARALLARTYFEFDLGAVAFHRDRQRLAGPAVALHQVADPGPTGDLLARNGHDTVAGPKPAWSAGLSALTVPTTGGTSSRQGSMPIASSVFSSRSRVRESVRSSVCADCRPSASSTVTATGFAVQGVCNQLEHRVRPGPGVPAVDGDDHVTRLDAGLGRDAGHGADHRPRFRDAHQEHQPERHHGKHQVEDRAGGHDGDAAARPVCG